jgi:outer membrane biosynthesis protein TonB
MTYGMVLEEHFKFRTPAGHLFQGYIDCFLQLETPPVIIDHKTSSNIELYGKTEETLRIDYQANLYAYYAMQKLHVDEVALQWIYYQTKKTKKSKKVRLTVLRDEVERRVQAIDEVADQIKDVYDRGVATALELPPTPEACEKYGGCPYRHLCNLSPDLKGKSIMGQDTGSNEQFAKLLAELRAKTPAVAAPAAVAAPVNPPEFQPPPSAPPPTVVVAEPEPVAEAAPAPAKRGRPKKDATPAPAPAPTPEQLQQAVVESQKVQPIGYRYDPAAQTDRGLTAPLLRNGRPAGLSNLTFCWEPPPEDCDGVVVGSSSNSGTSGISLSLDPGAVFSEVSVVVSAPFEGGGSNRVSEDSEFGGAAGASSSFGGTGFEAPSAGASVWPSAGRVSVVGGLSKSGSAVSAEDSSRGISSGEVESSSSVLWFSS